MDLLDKVQRKVISMIRGMEHLSCEDSLEEVRLFNLEKTRLWKDLTVAFLYLKGVYKEYRERYFDQGV